MTVVTTYAAHGLRASVPDGWDLRISRRPSPTPPAGSPPAAQPVPRPVLHASSVPIPADVGDFGGGVIERLGPDDVFIALVEYEPVSAGHGLFERHGMPQLAPSRFATNRLFRALPGRSASQQFFTAAGRPFCLYAVIGAHSRRMVTVPRAAAVARSFTVTGRTS